MYVPFFGLKQEPFSIAPDPRYLFMSERHREALAHLLYGVGGGGGFVLLTGEIGAGKTTVCRCFLEQIPRRCNVAYIFNPKLTVTELLKSVCDEFRIAVRHQGPGVATVKDYIDPLNDFLLRTHAVGQNNLLIIDEAQNLSADVLEQLRLLTNLETSERKLLQIVLIGQPELRTMLARPELEQVAQRIIARYHLGALSEGETTQYIRHRLAVAGMTRSIPFDRASLKRIHQLARGVPRRINLLADRALLGAYASERRRVDVEMVDKAAREVFDGAPRARSWRGRIGWLGIGLGVAGGAALAGVVAATLDVGARKPAARAAVPSSVGASAVTASTRGVPSVVGAKPGGVAPVGAAKPGGVAPVVATGTAPAAAAASASTDIRAVVPSLLRSEKAAWRELAPAWKVGVGEGDPCEAALRQQVRCFRSIGSNLALIRALDRPGIISLRDDDNRIGYALLTGLDDERAALRTAAGSHTVALAELAQLWRGDFATLWRAPAGYAHTLTDGESNPTVDALAARLAALRGEEPPARRARFDAALKSQIAAFQLAQGLRADGQAGPTTFMQLNRAGGVDEPRLGGANGN